MRFGKDMSIWQGCALGGTSIVNANVFVKPEKKVFEKFPKEILEQWELMEFGYSKILFLNFKDITARYYF
jgi:cholesterol oxidase